LISALIKAEEEGVFKLSMLYLKTRSSTVARVSGNSLGYMIYLYELGKDSLHCLIGTDYFRLCSAITGYEINLLLCFFASIISFSSIGSIIMSVCCYFVFYRKKEIE
jgi:hypothetical protein